VKTQDYGLDYGLVCTAFMLSHNLFECIIAYTAMTVGWTRKQGSKKEVRGHMHTPSATKVLVTCTTDATVGVLIQCQLFVALEASFVAAY